MKKKELKKIMNENKIADADEALNAINFVQNFFQLSLEEMKENEPSAIVSIQSLEYAYNECSNGYHDIDFILNY